MRKKHFIILIVLGILFGCASRKDVRVQDQPPKFFGRVLQNTLSKYNSVYNSNYIYNSSLIAGEDGYQENYTADFLPTSVQDAVASSGSMASEMDEILQKTATDISKRPYSKWVDDNYLLNGIAHYIKQDYEKALDIFLYTSSEYKNGVDYSRVGARQKMGAVKEYDKRAKQAEERLKEIEANKEAASKEIREKDKKRDKAAKRNRKKKSDNKLITREEQAKVRKKARKSGKELTTEEVLQEIRENQKKADLARKKITKQDIETINNSPLIIKNNDGVLGNLSHPLAAKDAMLWLAKTYITTNKFVAANAVLTAINEDENFPKRLNADYYLTYADLYIKIGNIDKAIEYVQLSLTETRKRDKGRLYFILGQLYEEKGDFENARIAFETVKKYHPEYNMIYYAKMRNYKKALENNDFATRDYTKELKKMSKDVKNEEFFGEVYYYLGEAYLAQGNYEKGIEALEASTKESPIQPFTLDKPHLALANYYYENGNYKQAQMNYASAAEKITTDSNVKKEAMLKSSSLEKIVASNSSIEKQDSLINLGKLPENELTDFLEKKAKDEIREKLRASLQEANSSFGTDIAAFQNNKPNNRRGRNSNTQTFYFYDLSIAANGFSDFKRIWGNRQNTDNWRRKNSKEQRVGTVKRGGKAKKDEVESLSKDDLVNKYLNEIPRTKEAREFANDVITQEYLNLASVFIKELGEYEKGEEYLKEVVENRYPSPEQMQEVQELLILTYKMKGDSDYIESLQRSEKGKKAVEKTAQKRKQETAGIDKLYELTYMAYTNGNYKKALNYIKETKVFSESENKNYNDKFAFIKAVSTGKIEGDQSLVQELKKFVSNYPKSELSIQAKEILKNTKK